MRIFSTQTSVNCRVFSNDEPITTDNRTITGYALVWNVPSQPDRDGIRQILLPGSAQFSTPTFALYNHDPSSVIGNTANQSLVLHPDERGIQVSITLPNTTTGNDVLELVGKGYVGGMSFKMVGWSSTFKTQNGQKVELVSRYTVPEVTVTGDPAFKQTSIELADGIDDRPVNFSKTANPWKQKLWRARLDTMNH